MKLDQESLSRSPAVYALGDPDLMELFEAYLGREGLRCRTFTDARVTLEEFVSAQPRPAVLVTGCLDYDGSGLALIRKCQEIEPGLKVVLWSGHDEKTMASLLAMIPVTVDARFPKGEACDMRKLVETIEALARDTGVAPLTAL